MTKIFPVFSKDNRSDDVREWVARISRDRDLWKDKIEMVTRPRESNGILVTGGDGTLLPVVHDYYHLNIPILGIDRGTMGFNLNPANSFEEFVDVLSNFDKHIVVTLQLVKATIFHKSGNETVKLAFNDVFVESPAMINGRVITEGAYAIDRYFRANGIIVATPQGSTAYTRSAGGNSAILPLEEDVLAVTTICPQGYPIQKAAEMKRVEVRFETRGEAVVTADFQKVTGAAGFAVEPSGKTVRLIFTEASNYQLKRLNVEEETERRKDRWIPKNL